MGLDKVDEAELQKLRKYNQQVTTVIFPPGLEDDELRVTRRDLERMLDRIAVEYIGHKLHKD